MRSFAQDIRAVLVPERKWHYVFHVFVMLVAASYWLGSFIKIPEATLAEIAMYRHRGDNQVYPVVAALSRLNLGDPTDSIHYGEGTAGAHAIILFPYVVSYALFGPAGYIVADVLLAWIYLVVVTVFLRQCGFGNFSGLVLGAALASRSLQILCNKLAQSLGTLLSLFDVGTWEWGFPDLLDMHIFVQRIPRPVCTEILVILLLYFLLRQWHERALPNWRRGVAIGGLLALLLQGDPFSLSALGLVLLWVMGCTLKTNKWRIPWRFVAAAAVSALIMGSYFLWQRAFEHPDCAVRFGMAEYPRNRILFLPGYAPLVRVGVVCFLAWMVVLAVKRLYPVTPEQPVASVKERGRKSSKTSDTTTAIIGITAPDRSNIPIEKSVASFWVAILVCAWLAQPVQLLLLGKGSQIYHYLLFVLPTFYGYGAVILLFTFLRLCFPSDVVSSIRAFGKQPRWTGTTVMASLTAMAAMVGMENKIATVFSSTNARQETNVPWSTSGDLYRPAFREVERQFRQNPALKDVRTFATYCYEVNFLLAGFYDKRAFLPDNAYSTLSDEELEDRLLETLKILQLPPEHLSGFIQVNFMLNYWLGCAKYWMTSDYQYAPRNDYTEQQWVELENQAKQTPWFLCLPQSELNRLAGKYDEVLKRESDRKTHPDALVVGLEKNLGLMPNPQWYREVYTNQLFSIYVKIDGGNAAQPATPGTPASVPGETDEIVD